jgi:hypothetical protein
MSKPKKQNMLERIADHVGVSPDKLTSAGLEALLREKKRQIMIEKLEIFSRYEVNSLFELEEKIRRGKIPEHPAWEDLILAENLENTVAAIDQDIKDLRKSA